MSIPSTMLHKTSIRLPLIFGKVISIAESGMPRLLFYAIQRIIGCNQLHTWLTGRTEEYTALLMSKVATKWLPHDCCAAGAFCMKGQ